MNELRQTLEDALGAAPPDSDTRELVGNALDILDTIPMESLEIMAKVERVRERMRSWGASTKVLDILREEFPDAKE